MALYLVLGILCLLIGISLFSGVFYFPIYIFPSISLIVAGVILIKKYDKERKKEKKYTRCEYCGYYCNDEQQKFNHYMNCEKKKQYDSNK